MHPVRRIMVIGIDGATWQVMRPLMERDNMPNLQRLVSQGAHGDLRSTLPPITGPAWRTFATGANPGKHGVIDFVELDPATRRVKVKDVSASPLPAFWDEAGAHGKRVSVVAVPMTYPPSPVNGTMLTGLMTPPNSTNYSYPRELATQLRKEGFSFLTSPGEGVNAADMPDYMRAVIRDMQATIKTGCYLFERDQPDVSVFVIGATDPIQHQFFHLMDPPSNASSDDQARQILDSFYHAVDEGIGQLLQQVDDTTLTLVVSDHGFGRLKGFIHLNNWLMERGYLRLKKSAWTKFQLFVHRMGYTPEHIYQMMRFLGIDMRRSMNKGRMFRLGRFAFLSFDNVDWENTRAYALGHIGQIYINRNRDMTVTDYQRLRDRLRDDLLDMRHQETGEPLIDQVHYQEDLYTGPYTESAPDIILEPHNYDYVAFGESEFASNRVVGPSLHTGHHRPEGILVMNGPGVQPGTVIDGASISDIAPTILYALELPVPQYMDGVPLRAAFNSEFLDTHQLVYGKGLASMEDRSDSAYTPEEEALVRKRLEDLGYTA